MFAVAGGLRPVRRTGRVAFLLAASDVVVRDGGSVLGISPYLSSNCCVLLYLVASFNLLMVFVRSFCDSFRRAVMMLMR